MAVRPATRRPQSTEYDFPIRCRRPPVGQPASAIISDRADEAGQAAFSAIVERHGPMVLGVCRQVLRNLHDADDAFQATFMVMARKAGTVQNSESLASWLHGIALRVAARAKADEARRRVHQRRFAKLRQVECDCESIRSESFPELHQEIARLPQRYREIVVLCYLEGLTSEQAAARIGCPPGTVFSRLSRARVRLRGSLVRRGVACPRHRWLWRLRRTQGGLCHHRCSRQRSGRL